jgi:hypothetical protein
MFSLYLRDTLSMTGMLFWPADIDAVVWHNAVHRRVDVLLPGVFDPVD